MATTRLPKRAQSGGGGPQTKGGVPGLDMVQELWKCRLRISAILTVLIVVGWCAQGFLGMKALEAWNVKQPLARQLRGGAAIEGWLFGTHPVVKLPMHNVKLRPSVSPLELDFLMDTALVETCGQVHRLLTSVFLHNGVFHILFNLGYLYTLAPLEAGAPGAYLCTFLLSGIAGNIFFAEFGAGKRALGASGAICGLMGFEIVSRMRNRQVRELRLVLRQAFGILVLGALLPGVCNEAHLGGTLAGLVVATLTARRSGYRNALLPWPFLMAGLMAWPTGRHFVGAVARAVQIGYSSPGALAHGLRLSW